MKKIATVTSNKDIIFTLAEDSGGSPYSPGLDSAGSVGTDNSYNSLPRTGGHSILKNGSIQRGGGLRRTAGPNYNVGNSESMNGVPMNTNYNPESNVNFNPESTNVNYNSETNYNTEPSTVLRPLKQYAQDNYLDDPRPFNYNLYYQDGVDMVPGKLKLVII